MSPELHELIESVRGLGIILTGKPAPSSVRLKSATNVVEKLERVQRALENFDKASGTGAGIDAPSPRDDPKKLKEALDRLIRLYQINGGNLSDVDDILRETLELEEDEKKAKKSTCPAFAPKGLRKKKGYKLRLNLMPDRPETATLNDIRKIVFEAEAAVSILGATVPNGRASQVRVARKFPPPVPGR